MDPSRAYRVLGLPSDSSKEEVREAYRDLAQVWHPDRFTHSERLAAKAEKNLKRINEAFEVLRNCKPSPEGSRAGYR
jgi:curved DNA-binding protein CbpA